MDRLYDVTTGYKNQNNICDLIVYKEGTLNYFECKAIHGNTLNFKSHIRENQWQGLLDKSYIGGVNAGIICWFIDKNATLFIPIETLENMRKQGKKSFNANETGTVWYNENGVKWGVDYFYIEGKKKRIFFEYDLEKFLEEISYA